MTAISGTISDIPVIHKENALSPSLKFLASILPRTSSAVAETLLHKADRSTTSVVQKIAIDCRFNLLAVCARDSHKTSRFQMLASHTLPDGSPAPPF
jgi:hypothetical protein